MNSNRTFYLLLALGVVLTATMLTVYGSWGMIIGGLIALLVGFFKVLLLLSPLLVCGMIIFKVCNRGRSTAEVFNRQDNVLMAVFALPGLWAVDLIFKLVFIQQAASVSSDSSIGMAGLLFAWVLALAVEMIGYILTAFLLDNRPVVPA